MEARMAFLVGPYVFLVGPYAFFRPYHFNAYGSHAGPFFLCLFPRKSRAGPYESYDKLMAKKMFCPRNTDSAAGIRT